MGSKENKYSMALNRRLYTTDDDVMSTGSRATLAKLYDRASAVSPSIGGGNVALRRDHVDPRVPRSRADGPSRAPQKTILGRYVTCRSGGFSLD